MGICNSKVAPYVDDNHQNTLDYIQSISNTVIHSLGKIRFSLLNNDTLSTTAINTEGLIDFTLVSMYTSVITTEDLFKQHYRFCCTLINHSSLIVTKLHNSITNHNTDEPQCKEPNVTVETTWCESCAPTNPLYELFQIAQTIQAHPLLSWSNIMTGVVPDYETVSQIYCLFRIYCQTMLNYMTHCSKTSELPPQTQYRTKVQTYDPNFTTPKAYVDEYRKLDRSLHTIMSMCEHVLENNIAANNLPISHPSIKPSHPHKNRRFSPNLTPVNE